MSRSRERRINRYYDPSTGQFVNVDPMVNETGDAYAYVGDDPINAVDPMGLNPFSSGWHNFASGFDATRHGIAAATDWASNKTNTAVCEDLPGPNRGSLAGWLQTQAGCGTGNTTDAALSSQSSSICPLSSSSGVGVSGTLRYLHSVSSLRDSPGYEYWNEQSTDEILKSLAPGNSDSLFVKDNGTILDGNTRTLVLQDRGYDINSLPKEIYQPIGDIPDLPEIPFEG
jgi:hypothetical protein